MCFSQFAFTAAVSTLVAIVGYLIYFNRKKSLGYWKAHGVPYVEPNWIFGNSMNEILQRRSWKELSLMCYNLFKPNGFGGIYIFCRPVLVVCDPCLIEKILIQDFTSFHDRNTVKLYEPLWNTLLNADGEEWRLLRHKLTPSFSSGKIKGMFDQIVNCCDFTIGKIKDQIHLSKPINVGSLAFEYSTEVIASCAFGVQLLADDIKRKSFKEAIDKLFNLSTIRFINLALINQIPRFCKLFGIKIVNNCVTDFFIGLTKSSIEYRKKNKIERNDFLNLLIALKNQEERDISFKKKNSISKNDTTDNLEDITVGEKEKIFTDDQIAALVFNFITGGLMPSSTTISFALFEIARNPDIQKKISEEIDVLLRRHKGFTYEAIREMEYLDLVVQETLRIYNFNTVLMRTVTEPYTIPGTKITLEKGLIVWIPTSALHMDPQHYPSPEMFIPERFSGNNYKPSPFFMPFGNGPRICIAMKFAILTVKVCLARILSKYSVELSEKMQVPLVFIKNEFYPKGGIWLVLKERN